MKRSKGGVLPYGSISHLVNKVGISYQFILGIWKEDKHASKNGFVPLTVVDKMYHSIRITSSVMFKHFDNHLAISHMIGAEMCVMWLIVRWFCIVLFVAL